MRNLKKKLQQIDALHTRQQDSQLDQQQQAKLAQRPELAATLEALQSGSSVEDAQRAAVPLKPLFSGSSSDLAQRSKRLSSVSSPDLLQRSNSTVSMDSSASSRKQRSGKHRQPSSQPSRLSMTENQIGSALLDTEGAAVINSTAATLISSSEQAQAAAQSSAEANAEEQPFAGPSQAAPHNAAEAALPMPSAWQRPGSTSAAGFTVSGFNTPQTQTTAATDSGPLQTNKTAAWPSPSGALAGLFDQAGTGPATSPSPGGSASRAKPRKGGLSMFLSGTVLSMPPVFKQVSFCWKIEICAWNFGWVALRLGHLFENWA